MSTKVSEHLDKFNEYNKLQDKIDRCNKNISALKRKKGHSGLITDFYWSDIQDNLGEHLSGQISKDIIALIEVEKRKLEIEQDKIEVGC